MDFCCGMPSKNACRSYVSPISGDRLILSFLTLLHAHAHKDWAARLNAFLPIANFAHFQHTSIAAKRCTCVFVVFFLFFLAVRWPKAHASTTVLTILMSFISITPIYLFSNIYLFDHSFMHIYFICTLKLLKCGVCLCLCAAVAAFLLFPACLPILLWM